MASLPNKADIVHALQAALPDAPVSPLELLAQILTGEQALTDAHQSDGDLGTILRGLAGSTLKISNSTIQFGSDNQFGDVTFRDVAGRDILHINVAQTIITAEQAYNVAGLPNPYLGLRAFTYDDRQRFAGREGLIAAAVNLLTMLGEQRTLLFITGASGSGKSSLAQAGVIPALESYYAERRIPVQHAVFRPSRQPLAALADTLVRLGVAAIGPFAIAAPHTVGIPSALHNDAVAVLVIDQAEELFTQSEPDQREALLHMFGALPPFRELRMHILCTLRNDFLGDLAAYRTLEPAFREQLLVRVMDKVELKEAIQRPIQDAHPQKRIEPALLQRLAADASDDATYLPLLQVTLEDLWQRGSMTLGAYTTLTDAIRERAETVYRYQDYDGARQQVRGEDEQETLLSLLLGLIEVGPDDDSRRDVRRRRSLAELAQGSLERTRLTDDLTTARLLSKSVEQRAGVEVEVVDIIHESLIANWKRLQDVITARRAALQRRTRFEAALQLWESRGKPDTELLASVRLAEAQALAEVQDIGLNTANAREFLGRSVTRQEVLQRQQLRRTQVFAGILGILLLVAVATGFWAIDRSDAANHQASVAQTAEANTKDQFRLSNAQRLGIAAQSESSSNPTGAVLLAAEAFTNMDTQTTADILRTTLDLPVRSRVTLGGHSSAVRSAAYSPDGRQIVTASADTTAIIWDAASGAKLTTLSGHRDAVWSAAYSPDGRQIVTASRDRTAIIWDAASGAKLTTLSG
ncbi:MAG: hypothetical protein WCI67_16105, partial [Chloroflexales bacterium]